MKGRDAGAAARRATGGKSKKAGRAERKLAKTPPLPSGATAGDAPAAAVAAVLPAADPPGLLERARARWELGDWAELMAMDGQALAVDPERGKLALLIAAAHGQAGDLSEARRLARQALAWGCSRTIAARVLLSSIQHSLARAATAAGEDSQAQFEAAVRLAQPNADAALLGRMRRLRELARMGLLPEAVAALQAELGLVREIPGTGPEQLRMLETGMRMVRESLSHALNRRQLWRPAAAGPPESPGAEALAVLSSAQLGQDLWVLERTGHKRGGFFVEFGATDGVLLSNTLMLERHFGWTGICAEPNPDYFAALRRNRRCITSDACIGPATGARVEFVLADEFGTIREYLGSDGHLATRDPFLRAGRTVTLTTVSLHDFLVAHGAPQEIDYLSIDTEGSEYDILSAFPFERWRIRLLTVEHNFTPARERIFALLTSKGYRRTEAKWDDWYELVA